jgi:amino acid transporter
MKTLDKIGTFPVVILILTACLGVRWIPVAGSMGPPAILFWIAGAMMFFIPLSGIILEMTRNYTQDGGIYLWVKRSLGNKYAFYAAWFYWINNFFFYPALLIFMVDNVAYLIGNQHLAENHLFVITSVIISLWVAILVNIQGVKWIAKIASMACLLNIGLVLFIIGSALLYLIFFHDSATSFSAHHFLPTSSLYKNLSNLTLLMFALSGIELIPAMAGSIKNAQTTLKRGIVISGSIILISYIAGTLAINIILNPNELNNTTGLMETILVIATKLHVAWLSAVFIFMLFLVEFGALIVWLVAPTVIFFECVEPGILPLWMQKLNKHSIPANALIFIGCTVTLIIIAIQYLPTINSIFTTLTLMGTIVYFFPYLLLVVGYIKLKAKNLLPNSIMNKKTGYFLAICLFFSVSLGMLLSIVPSADIHSKHAVFLYEIELIGGPVLFSFVGYFLYRRHTRR